MNLGSIVVILILVLIVVLDIRYLRRNGIDGCGGDCGKCHGSCKWTDDLKRARADIAAERKQ